MEKYATLNLPYSSLQGLTRTASFSELPIANRRIIFQESDSTGGLVKQYSYEQIFINDSNNIKKIQHSTLITTEKKLSGLDIWKKNIPIYHSASNIAWPPRNSSPDLSTMNIKKEKMHETTESPDLWALNGLKISDHEPSKEDKKIRTAGALLTAVVPSNNVRQNIDHENPSLLVRKMIERKAEIVRPSNYVRQSIDHETPSLLVRKNMERKVDSNKSDIETKAVDCSQIKKNLRSLLPQEIIQEPSKSKKRCIKAGLVVLVGLVAVILASLSNNTKAMPFDFTNTSLELQQNVFGQDEAIKELSIHFYLNADDFTVVVLIGGTGVGKSYTKEIIRKHFPHSYNIFEYIPPLQKFIVPAYDALSSLQCNFVILENLKSDDLQDLVKFTQYFYNQKERPCVIILAIINPQTIDNYFVRSVDLDKSIKDVDNLFSRENIPVKTIGFKCLSFEVINACIDKEAKKSNIKLSDQQFEEVRKSIVTANSGCKGAYAKVQLYTNLS